MCRATTITISGYSSSGRRGVRIEIRQTKHTFMYKSVAMKSSTKQPKNVERQREKWFWNFSIIVFRSLFRQVKIRFEKCRRKIISKSVRYEIKSPILIWYSECVWRKAKWVLEAMERNEENNVEGKNLKYIFAVMVKRSELCKKNRLFIPLSCSALKWRRIWFSKYFNVSFVDCSNDRVYSWMLSFKIFFPFHHVLHGRSLRKRCLFFFNKYSLKVYFSIVPVKLISNFRDNFQKEVISIFSSHSQSLWNFLGKVPTKTTRTAHVWPISQRKRIKLPQQVAKIEKKNTNFFSFQHKIEYPFSHAISLRFTPLSPTWSSIVQ